uniref:Olfactory receptor n=2 Tax=Pyxicephalus adspersus TaxID=30357 RepID=A0AAV2ZVH8_PYXAD|nr:TPA: hypothetical protein GDO54_016658 [Pyxicephalus adspersus]
MTKLVDNGTIEFQFLAFFSNHEKQPLLFTFFLLVYLIGLLGNLIIITVICADFHLHTPMYFFLCNLSFIDISYTTVTLPKLMDMLLTGNNSISFVQCFTQMFFFTLLVVIEVVLLSSMAYDRFIAICNPLQYQLIMNRKVCVLLLVGIWIQGCLNSAVLTIFVFSLPLCYSKKMKHFFCNIKALVEISCPDRRFDALFHVEVVIFGLGPLFLSMSSYIMIIKVVLSISASGRRKTFSTCTSHLTVLLMFYGTILFMYMRPTSRYSGVLDQASTVMYAAVAPMLNPLIYSLRNKEVKYALIQITRNKKDSI